MVLGVVSAFFTPSIQAALTLVTTRTIPPAVHPTQSTTAPAKVVMPTPIITQPVIKPTATASVAATTPTPMTMNILAQDTFQRNDQRFWGTASNGQPWGGLANSSPSFSIMGHTGFISNGAGAFDATLGMRTTDADIVFSGSVSQLGMSNMGAVLRWTDANNWYKAYIDGTQCFLIKRVAGTITVVALVPFAASSGTIYSMRFRVVGSTLAARVWMMGQTEPATWLVMAKDTSLQTGFGGLRLVVQNGVVVKIMAFTEMVATTIP
jgi:hypothetical protein